MITQYKIILSRDAERPLYADAAYRLYAHLLEMLPAEDAQWLHEEGGRGLSQWLTYDKKQNQYVWTINLLGEQVRDILAPVLEDLEQIRIADRRIPILERTKHTVTPEDLILQGRCDCENRSTMIFLTLTSFRQNNRYVIFPQERLILQSLINRWNEVFPEYPLEDEDAFQAILAGLHIVDYQLRSGRFFLKGVKIPGFTGSCVIEAKLAHPLKELWITLLLFGSYTGLGIKTGLGMGGVQTEVPLRNQPDGE